MEATTMSARGTVSRAIIARACRAIAAINATPLFIIAAITVWLGITADAQALELTGAATAAAALLPTAISDIINPSGHE